jgi:hypothetical protein
MTQGQATAFYSAPQDEGALHSSSCLCAHHNRSHRVLRRPLLLLPPTPTTVVKARVKGRGRGKRRTTAPVALATTGVPRRGPPSTIPGSAPSRCGQGSTTARRAHCTSVLRGSRRSLLRTPTSASSAPAAGHDPIWSPWRGAWE